MKRFLLLGALAAAMIVPAAVASPSAIHTIRGTVVAKDRAHRGLVVALPGGAVKTIVAPRAFGRTDVGRNVVIRYTALAGRLPVARAISLEGRTRHAVVRGTIVRVVRRNAVINAGGTALRVHLTAPKAKRLLAAVPSTPSSGDTVEVEVEIAGDGSLGGSAAVVGASSGTQVGSSGEMEVRGKVTLLSPLTVETGTPPVQLGCAVPADATLGVSVGDMIELRCDLIGGVWTVRAAHDEDEPSGDDDASEAEVRGTLAYSPDGLSVIVTPLSGPAVTCAIPGSVLAEVTEQFAAGDIVKLECVTIGEALTLKEIEKKSDHAGGQSGGGDSGSSGSDDESDGSDDEGDS